MEVSLIWLTIVVVLASSLLMAPRRKKKIERLPPGPKGVPILGHLHMMGKNPHQDLQRIAKEHGPIMYMRFGFVPNIVVSSPEAAELFLKTYDHVFASRPPHQAAKLMSWDQRNLSFGAYGPYWRNMRKLCTLELLNTLKINSFQPMRREELGLFVESLKEAAKERVAVDLTAKVSSLTAEMSCRMVFGKKYDERGFKTVIREGMKLAAAPNLGDYFPFLGTMDLQGLTGRMKALLQDMLAASMDTSASTVEWILSELDRLEYLNMVVKETFRLHPVAPLLIPHYAMEDSTVGGMICKGSPESMARSFTCDSGSFQTSSFRRRLLSFSSRHMTMNLLARPPNQAAKYMAWGQRNLSFGVYGPYWRNMLKLCTLELLSIPTYEKGRAWSAC